MTYKKNTKRRSVWFIDLDDTLHDAANGTLKNIDLADIYYTSGTLVH